MNILVIIIGLILQLSADFCQTKQSQFLVEEQKSTGRLIYRSPNYLRWEYTSPMQLTWEIEGEKSNVSPQIKRLLKIIIQTIACENLESNTDFNVSHEGDMYNLVPQNRELKQFFTLIQLEIDPNTKIAKRVVLNEKNGDITTINFYNVCL